MPHNACPYLAEIADVVREYHALTDKQVRLAHERQQLQAVQRMLDEQAAKEACAEEVVTENAQIDLQSAKALLTLAHLREQQLEESSKTMLAGWNALQTAYAADEFVVKIRDKEIRTQLTSLTLSGLKIRKVALPRFEDHGEILRWLRQENVPCAFPYNAGVFAFKREGEDPTRMFAGEGDPFRTNRRFKLLSEGMEAKRLSTAFDSVTLYGAEPDLRPNIYGKIGNSGVSVATLDDMRVLYDGFDLCDPATSVSMTINGSAPTILAMFMNTAIDQQFEHFRQNKQREPTAEEAVQLRAWVLKNVRGTVQADILKENQGQNTCIFSTEFSLKVMGDIQQYFVEYQVRNLKMKIQTKAVLFWKN